MVLETRDQHYYEFGRTNISEETLLKLMNAEKLTCRFYGNNSHEDIKEGLKHIKKRWKSFYDEYVNN